MYKFKSKVKFLKNIFKNLVLKLVFIEKSEIMPVFLMRPIHIMK